MSMRPHAFCACAIIACIDASLVTSAAKASHFPLASFAAIAQVSCAEARSRSTASTAAPSCANRMTVARPLPMPVPGPWPAPMTMAVLSRKRMMFPLYEKSTIAAGGAGEKAQRRPRTRSFPRKRESSSSAKCWVPAFAGTSGNEIRRYPHTPAGAGETAPFSLRSDQCAAADGRALSGSMNETSRKKPGDSRTISIRGAREHNLKNIDVAIRRDQLVVFTGLSGSGKSSLAFDTIYAEGQRRYVESLSAYARQFLEMMQKPDVDQIDGLSPAISIEQKTTSKNPRSTVGTVTEIYDYMRLLWARAGIPYS